MGRSKILVWDVPTRAFHWLLALSFAGAFVTAESERYRDVHVMLGYTALGLVAFRLLWGVVGTRYARFRSFAFGPRSMLTYVKSLFTRSPQHYPGHNPAGSWAVYALLAFTMMAAATGIVTYSVNGGHWMEEVHEAIANALLAIVFVHIAGVLASSFVHRENLVGSMLTGYKSAKAEQGIRTRHRLIGAALVTAVAAFWLAGPDSLPSAADPAAQRASVGEHRGHD